MDAHVAPCNKYLLRQPVPSVKTKASHNRHDSRCMQVATRRSLQITPHVYLDSTMGASGSMITFLKERCLGLASRSCPHNLVRLPSCFSLAHPASDSSLDWSSYKTFEPLSTAKIFSNREGVDDPDWKSTPSSMQRPVALASAYPEKQQ